MLESEFMVNIESQISFLGWVYLRPERSPTARCCDCFISASTDQAQYMKRKTQKQVQSRAVKEIAPTIILIFFILRLSCHYKQIG